MLRITRLALLTAALIAPAWSLAAQSAGDDSNPAVASGDSEQKYRALLDRAQAGEAEALFRRLQTESEELNWAQADAIEVVGNLRFLKMDPADPATNAPGIYLIRSLEGELFVLTLPEDRGELAKGSASVYAGLADQVKFRMSFPLLSVSARVDGEEYRFVRYAGAPERGLLDRLFYVFIILMLFFVMMGMGMTLRLKDFALVLLKPKAMIVGPLCQFGVLPALAVAFGYAAGYPEEAPFIFVGLILVSASPGGVTSNLMTYWAKGDLALSVSMTAISTILSLFFTPLILTYYASSVPTVVIPVKDVALQIMALVIVPLIVGMAVRRWAEAFALKSEKFFSALGVFALLFLIITGVANNLDKFSDLDRYGLKFYAVIFGLTISAMVFSMIVAKLLSIDNFQIRAIALETGLQNAALAMTIAILLQDRMGDFNSSMFAVAGLFGLWMYVAGGIMIAIFPRVLPVDHKVRIKDER
ncbi:MAG: bile acid:sodium symporter family protein [bacterium]|nr:bile acid:sodium symporter family protein [bacterium]